MVEDSEDQIRMCKSILSRGGEFLVDVAREGREALAKIGKNNYDAILLDYMLSDITGLDILKKVKKDGYKKPIIMVTAEGSEEIAIDALKNGAADYIRKTGNYYVELPHIIQKNLEKYRLKEELRESEKKYRTLIETINEGVLALDLDGRITFANRKLADMLGYGGEEVLGKKAKDFLDKKNKKIMDIEFKKGLAGESSSYELEIITKKRGKVSVLVSASPLYDKDGGVSGSIAILTEITEIKELNAELLLLQKINNAINMKMNFNEILQIIIDGLKTDFGYETSAITLLSQDKKFLELKGVGVEPKVFRAIEKYTGLNILGYKIPLYDGSTHKELIEEKKPILTNDAVAFYENWTDQEKLKPLAKIVVRITNPKSLISVPLVAEEKVFGTIGVGSSEQLTYADVERLERFSRQVGMAMVRAELEHQLRDHAEHLERRVEERTHELKRSEERYRDLFDNVDDIVYTHDLMGRFKSINKVAEELLGFEKNEFLAMNISDLVDARDSDHIPVVLSTVLREGTAQGFELWLTSKDGQKIPFEGNASLIREDDKPVGIRAILRDISDRKRHEEELMQKLMKYRWENGRVYLTFDRKFNDAEDIIEDAINSGFRGVIISRTNPSEIRRRFGNHVKILWLSKTKSDKVAVSPELSKLTVIIKELASPYTLVFLDRLDYLITQNGFERVLRFIQSLNDILYFEKGVLVISVDPKTLKPKELSLLENEVSEVELKHRLDISTDLLEILRHVYKQNKQGKSPSYKEIGRKFEITKGTVRKRINLLKNEGLIVERKRGRFKNLELSDDGKALF